MKFAGTESAELVRQARSPADAKKLGQQPGLRADWDDVRDGIMYTGCLAKFSQHARLRRLLLDTGDAYLVEVSLQRLFPLFWDSR